MTYTTTRYVRQNPVPVRMRCGVVERLIDGRLEVWSRGRWCKKNPAEAGYL